jgi:hypothetical protein
MNTKIFVAGATSLFELWVKECHIVDQLQFFIRIIHSTKLPGGEKRPSEQSRADRYGGYDRQGTQPLRLKFGMPVNQSADVHALGDFFLDI